MSTIVREVLTAFIRKMQQGNHISAYDRDQLEERIRELSRGELETPEISMQGFFEEEETEPDMSTLASQVLQNIEREGEPVGIVEEEVTIAEAAQVEVTKQGIDLFSVECEPYDSFKDKAPKDRLIEWAESLDVGNPKQISMKALAITYSNLPQSQWGSKEAEESILRLLGLHLAKDD
jgi:hypothetical protein